MSSLDYRKQRTRDLLNKWNLTSTNELFVSWKIPSRFYTNLQNAIKLYISKALDFDLVLDDTIFMELVDKNRNNRKNVTPNGAVVPKKEYSLEYNLFLAAWCAAVREMIAPDKKLLKRFRLTPNIRIKYGLELDDNIGRGLDTAIPHSDAWVEGPWGMNCHLPILGDTERNFLNFYKLIDDKKFTDDFLVTSNTYNDMQWVLKYYEEDKIIPKKGFINISDYALIHNTKRLPNCGTRISIDTTIFVGDHDVHPDRVIEYLDSIPEIGNDLFVKCNISENSKHHEKKTVFSNYTSGTLEHIDLNNGLR